MQPETNRNRLVPQPRNRGMPTKPIHHLPAFVDKYVVNAVVETPQGSRHKFRGVPIIGLFMTAARMLPGRKKVLLYSVQRLKRRRPAFFRDDLMTLFELLRERRIAPIIAELMPLHEVRRAHERLGSGSVSGKIILLCEEHESTGAARSFSELALSGEPCV